MKTFEGKIIIDKERLEDIERMLTVEPEDEEDFYDNYLGEDETITETFTFENGYFMDIQVCGVQYEEGGCNTMWTQAVLYDPEGCQARYTEPSESFDGEWKLEFEDDGCEMRFVVFVESSAEKEKAKANPDAAKEVN